MNVMFHGNRFVAASELVYQYETENPGIKVSWTSLPPKNTINAIKSIGRDPEISSLRFLPDIVMGPKSLETVILPLREDGVHLIKRGKYSSVSGLVLIARHEDNRLQVNESHSLAEVITRNKLRVVLPGYQEKAQPFIRAFEHLLGEGALDRMSAAGLVDVSEIRHHRDIPARIQGRCSDVGIQFYQSKVYWNLHSPGAFQFIDIAATKPWLQREDSYLFVVSPNLKSDLKIGGDKAEAVDTFVRYMFSPSATAILRRYGLQPN